MLTSSKSFADIEEIAQQCRYSDCRHEHEPECAIREAVENGTLSIERFESYKKLQKELEYEGLDSRQRENAKIKKMFGSKGEMKKQLDYVKNKNMKSNSQRK